MKIILLDPNLVRPFFGNKFFNPNYGAYLENNYFLMRTKLGYLRYSVFLNVPIKRKIKTKRNLIVKEKENYFISTSL